MSNRRLVADWLGPLVVFGALALVPELGFSIPKIFDQPISSPGTLALLGACLLFGGLGSIGGSAVAAVVVALTQQYTNYYASAGIGDMVVVLLLGVVLLVRPRGSAGAVVGARA